MPRDRVQSEKKKGESLGLSVMIKKQEEVTRTRGRNPAEYWHTAEVS